MENYTIQISDETWKRLSSLKRDERDDYDGIIRRLLDDSEDDGLSCEDWEAIKRGLWEIAAGKSVSEKSLLNDSVIE